MAKRKAKGAATARKKSAGAKRRAKSAPKPRRASKKKKASPLVETVSAASASVLDRLRNWSSSRYTSR